MPTYNILLNYNFPTPVIDGFGNAFQGAASGPLYLENRIEFRNIGANVNSTFDSFNIAGGAELIVTDDTAISVNSSLMTNLLVSGSITSQPSFGILVFGNGAATTNIAIATSGRVQGATGIAVFDDAILNNSGYVGGVTGIPAVIGAFTLVNKGVVTGGRQAIDLGFEGSKFIDNDGGLIVGDILTDSDAPNDSSVTILNREGSAIYGRIILSRGADNVDTRLGTLENRFGSGTSEVFMGAGGDTFFGGASKDVVNGGDGADFLYGGIGNDSLFGGATDASVDSLYGQDGNDDLSGGGGNDTLIGGDGNDNLFGGSGSDSMNGGAGNDVYYVDADALSDSDTIEEFIAGAAGGVDTLMTARGGFTLGANVENLTLLDGVAIGGFGNGLANVLFGNSNNNTLEGFGGNDTIIGGVGADTMRGGLGDDRYSVDNAGDLVVEAAGQGIDRVNSFINYTLGANVETLVLYGTAVTGRGNALANTIIGNDAGNALFGDLGADILSGAGGDDFLRGGRGLDSLTGGSGFDKFVFDTAFGVADADTITDFVAVNDTIWLDDSVFTGLARGSLAANLFKTIGAGGALDADDRIAYDISDGKLYYDSNGAAAGGWAQIATLTTKPALTAADFIVF